MLLSPTVFRLCWNILEISFIVFYLCYTLLLLCNLQLVVSCYVYWYSFLILFILELQINRNVDSKKEPNTETALFSFWIKKYIPREEK